VKRRARAAWLIALATMAACAHRPDADIVFRDGPVYTVDSLNPRATAVAVTGTRIVYVGDYAGVSRFIGPSTRIVELRGRMLLPAFHDSHVHPVTAGMRMTECALAHSLGIVAMQEADADSDILAAYRILDKRHALTARVVASIHVDPAAGVAQIQEMRNRAGAIGG
jgi:predicted amidohydrolase YtcJ